MRLRFTETVCIDHDIIRCVFKNKGRASPNDKFMLYDKEDFGNFGLPQFWNYYFDALGQGVKVIFPIKIRMKLGFTSARFVVNENGVLDKAPLTPLEKVVIVNNRRACSQMFKFIIVKYTQCLKRYLLLKIQYSGINQVVSMNC